MMQQNTQLFADVEVLNEMNRVFLILIYIHWQLPFLILYIGMYPF